MTSIGELHERIEIWEKVRLSNGEGGWVYESNLLREVFAKVEKESDSSRLRYGQDQLAGNVRFTIRQTPLPDKIVVRYKGNYYKVIEQTEEESYFMTLTGEGETNGNDLQNYRPTTS